MPGCSRASVRRADSLRARRLPNLQANTMVTWMPLFDSFPRERWHAFSGDESDMRLRRFGPYHSSAASLERGPLPVPPFVATDKIDSVFRTQTTP